VQLPATAHASDTVRITLAADDARN